MEQIINRNVLLTKGKNGKKFVNCRDKLKVYFIFWDTPEIHLNYYLRTEGGEFCISRKQIRMRLI